MKLIYGLIAAASAIFALGLLAQDKAERKEFEVASIKPAQDTPDRFNFGIHIDGAQVRCNYATLKDYVTIAYRLKTYQFSGPEWMTSARFDISAKLPEGATRADVPAMLQHMLEDRFQLKFHRASKEFPVYALTAAKNGVKMKESAPTADAPPATNVEVNAAPGSDIGINLGNGSSITIGEDRLSGSKVTMAQLADQLGRFMERPVVDQTGLNGIYDFNLEFTPEDMRVLRIRSAITAGVQLPPQAMRLLENASDAPILAAVQTLGLKLESKKAPLEVLVVDSALKTPSGN